MKKTIKGIFKLALPVATFGILIGSAPSANATELVCVNGDELFKLSNAAQQLKKEMEQKRDQIIKNYQNKAQDIQKKLQTLQQELQSGLLTDEAKKAKQEEFIKLQQELQKLQYQAQMELQKFAGQQLKKLDELVKSALKALSKTEGFKAVADCQRLLYADPSIDITQKVAKVIDQIAKTAKGKK
jgi:outer membrane protein